MAETAAQEVEHLSPPSLKAMRPKVKKPEELERTVQGIKVPTTRMDHQAVAFVLNQSPGKLPLKDLVSFIKEQREAAESRRRVAAREGGGDKDEEEEVADEDKQALELRFELRYREVDKSDRDKDLKSSRATGEDPPSAEDVNRTLEGRRRRHERLLQLKMQLDVSRVEPVVRTTRVAIPNNFHPPVDPKWDLNGNDTFSVRLQVIERFVRAGSKVLMRVRAQRRANAIRQALKENNVTDRQSCKAWVEAETKAAATTRRSARQSNKKQPQTSANAEAAAGVEVVHLAPDFVLPWQFPVAQSGLSVEDRAPVDVVPLDNFEEFLPVTINVRLDYKVFNYERQTIPPPSAYMRPNLRQRLDAALEEHLIRGPRGDALDGAEMPICMPDSCLLPPEHDALSLLIPSTECRTFVAFPESTECDPAYLLAQMPPLIEPLQAESLLPPGTMSLETPWVDKWRSKRKLQDPFQLMDPICASFAAFGDPLGPCLGSDTGGQRLPFMPVGGFERDLPSDTDDDERDEMDIPAPDQAAHDRARQCLAGPVRATRWDKEKIEEDCLQSGCRERNRAVRDRLKGLNEALSHRSKLFLG